VIETSKGAAGKLAVTLACLIALSTQTMTAVAADPIPGVDVVVEKIPPGSPTARLRTDSNGCLVFKFLQSGRYEVYDKFGNRASLEHDGGPARWRLIGSIKERKPVWSLVNECDPL